MLLGSGGGTASGAAIAIVNTAGAGGFFTPTVFVPEDASVASNFSAVADQVRVTQFVLPFRATITKVTVEVTTLQAGKIATLGIYDPSGNKLIDSGTFDVGSTGFKQNTFSSATLQPDTYYFAWCCDGISAQTRYVVTALGTSAGGFTGQGTARRRGTAANAMVAGVLPTTLGTITNVNALSSVIAYWEP